MVDDCMNMVSRFAFSFALIASSERGPTQLPVGSTAVQARVLDLLQALQREFGIAFLFISHDMAVVENISDRVAVMYLGQIVETGTRVQVFGNPQHPYTQRLIEAVPVPDPSHIRTPSPRLAGAVPSPVHLIGQGPAPLVMRDMGDGHLVALQAGQLGE